MNNISVEIYFGDFAHVRNETEVMRETPVEDD